MGIIIPSVKPTILLQIIKIGKDNHIPINKWDIKNITFETLIDKTRPNFDVSKLAIPDPIATPKNNEEVVICISISDSSNLK